MLKRRGCGRILLAASGLVHPPPGANDSLYHLSEYAAAHLPTSPLPFTPDKFYTVNLFLHPICRRQRAEEAAAAAAKRPRCQSTLSLECLHVSRAPGGIDFASMTCRVNRLISPAVFIQRCPLLRGLHMRSQMAFAGDERRRVRRAPLSAFFCRRTGTARAAHQE